MELTKPSKQNVSQTRNSESDTFSLPPPAPFSSQEERQELERALLSPTEQHNDSHPETNTTSSASSAAEAIATTVSTQQFAAILTQQRRIQEREQQQHHYDIPTAVPISATGDDDFAENFASAIAVASPTTISQPNSLNSTTNRYETQQSKNNDQKQTAKDKQDEVIVEPENLNSNNSNYYNNNNSQTPLPTVPTLPTPTTHLPTTHQLNTSTQLRQAQYFGKLSSEEEKAGIARAQRERGAIRYHAGRAVKVANQVASEKAGRWDEGLTVMDYGNYGFGGGVDRVCTNSEDTNATKKEEGDDSKPKYGTTLANGERGYEVAEYNLKEEYDVQEYDVSEYKSVYD